MSAAPTLDGEQRRERILLKGEVPSPLNPPSGCRFRTRCWKATEICATTAPPNALDLEVVGHAAECHHPLLAAPIVALVDPRLIPGTLIMVATVVTLIVVIRERPAGHSTASVLRYNGVEMKIVVADANLVPHRERFEAALPDARVCWQGSGVSPDELRDADVYVGSRFTAAMADAAEKLKLIHIAGAGTDKVDFDALPPEMLVANTFHHEQSIAEYVVAAAVMLRRDFLTQDRELRCDIWATAVYDPAIPQPRTLGDAHVGFVGFGHIGQRAWNLLRAFGCTGAAVTGSGRVADAGLAWTGDSGELDRLLRECDVAVVSAPLNQHTEGMIGAPQLQALGPDGVLINVGRGLLVQERALYDALAGGVIRAAAIDVWYRYPSGDDVSAPGTMPFADLPNLLMTPHSSGVTRDTFTGRVDDVVANIGRLQRGEPLRNVVHGG